MNGAYGLTDFFDSPGPMAKCPADVQALLEITLSRTFLPSGFGEWKDVAVGFADPRVWKMAEAMCRQHDGTAEQMVSPRMRIKDVLCPSTDIQSCRNWNMNRALRR